MPPLHSLLVDVVPFGRYAGRSWDSIESDREFYANKRRTFAAAMNAALRLIEEKRS